ncbi:UNVERIFIED_CONTAM: protein NRT1/ PTR FAMILY 4.3 [Sesamum latifolium]|uniref:Protein NRT1/ PTR FAMILY 4.3 n=1 Tax=Sesamum latifolium TaxID=2727402 RepID=A0AAW2XL33_9LAMI
MEKSRMQEEESYYYNKGERVYEETSSHVDWRGRPTNPNKHGGMRAAAFVLGLQGFEIMGIAAVGNNLISYVINEMHFPLSKSANTGFILLSVQAHLPQLKPPQCNMLSDSGDEQCVEAKGMQALIFFVALYLVALGSGCVKPNMIAHGADQFYPNQSKKLSTYFNSAYFAFSMGELVALTLLVYVQTHSGMDVGFGVSAAAMAMGLITFISGAFLYKNKPPQGSILTPIAQVFVAATLKRKHVCPSDPVMSHGIYHKEPNSDKPISNSFGNPHPTERFRPASKYKMEITRRKVHGGFALCPKWSK